MSEPTQPRDLGSGPEQAPSEEYRELLPQSLVWLYLAGVLFSAFIMDPYPWERWSQPLLNVAASSVPFAVIPILTHSLYQWVMPALLCRVRPGAVQAALHVLAVLLVGMVGALITAPLFSMIADKGLVWGRFVLICLAFSAGITLPALAIQRLRHRTREAERRAQEQKRAALEAQLAALQARTNPHFLFNSINTVASLIPENPALAEATLERLADIFRYSLDSCKTRLVPLSRELAIVEDYLHVQAARYEGRFRWSVEVAAEVEVSGVKIPPLTLQPLVENAVLHGMDQGGCGGDIKVRVAREEAGGRIRCTIRDDGPGYSERPGGSGTAVADTRQRLQLVFGDRAQLVVGPIAPEGGFEACVSVPAEAA